MCSVDRCTEYVVLQEITDVLMPVMQNRVTCLCERKTDKCPRKELTPLHVDGTTF